ncbi:MAG TPA: hypothetical protein PLL57_14845 [Flavobacteriales bacterium]|nr:hypothetical protein [Flavobacteriales bacterium]
MSRQLVINSAVCYALAFLFTTVLHEGGHAVVGWALGSNPVLHHNYVAHLNRADLPVAYQAWIALAGPLVSLMQGLVLWLVVRSKDGGGLGRLFLLWAMMLGFGNFLGYLMTGPLFVAGDIGKVEVLLGLPMIVRVALAVIGAAGLTAVAYWSTRPFLAFAPEPVLLADAQARTRFNFRIIILPWLVGAATITMLYLPVVAIVSIIYPITSGMVFIFPWKNARRVGDARASGAASVFAGSWYWYAALLVAVLLFRLVLAPGIAL